MNNLNIGKWVNLKLALRQTEADQIFRNMRDEEKLKARELLSNYIFHNIPIPEIYGLDADINTTADEDKWLEEFVQEVKDIVGTDTNKSYEVPLPHALSSSVCLSKWKAICKQNNWDYLINYKKVHYYTQGRRREYLEATIKVFSNL